MSARFFVLLLVALLGTGCTSTSQADQNDTAPWCHGPSCYRLRLTSRLPADGRSAAPVFVDVLDPALVDVPIDLRVSRGGKSLVIRKEFQYAFDASDYWKTDPPLDLYRPRTGWWNDRVGDWYVPFGENARIHPCNAAEDPECLGPVEVTITEADQPDAVLATATVELLPPTPELAMAPCENVGNVAVWNGMVAAGFTYGIPAERSTVLGPWTSHWHRQDYANAPGFDGIWVSAYHHTFDIARDPIEIGTSLMWPDGSHSGTTAGVMATDGHCFGGGELTVHELELGEWEDPHQRWVDRISYSWNAGCSLAAGTKHVTVPIWGCVHYDAWNAWPNGKKKK